MNLTNKRFWLRVTATAAALSAMPLLLYGNNYAAIALTVASFVVVAAICPTFFHRLGVIATWFAIFVSSLGVYLIDVFIIAEFRLIRTEPYPLIVSQIYFFPLYVLISGLICTVGGIIMNKSRRRWAKALPLIVVILFFIACWWCYMITDESPDDSPAEHLKTAGLTGNVKSIFFTDPNTGIALSSFTHPDSPDTVRIYRTSDGGRSWRTIAELPDQTTVLNPTGIGNHLFGAIQADSAYRLLSIDITNERLTFAPDHFTRLPILFESDGRPGYTADSAFVITDPSFTASDTVGAYDIQPANKGLAIAGNHIFGFYFDADSCVSRLYDFIDKTIIDNFSSPGDASLIKTSDKSCLILAARDRWYQEMYSLDAATLKLQRKSSCAYKIMNPLRTDCGTVYTLLADGPDDDKWLMFGDASWQSWTFRSLNASGIKAYCMVNDRFIYYDPFSHEIIRFDLKSTASGFN